jgi:TPR repeat protein
LSIGDEEFDRRKMKRVEANDPAAMTEMGITLYHEGDYESSFLYFTDAAKLGDVEAHYHLGVMYDRGEGVEKDKEKEVYHYERAAIGGHPSARFNLGNHEEWNGGRVDRAVKHWIISANLGHTRSMEALWDHYKLGNMSKEDLEATLRTHQAAVDATKSPQRDAAAAARRE